MNQCDSNRTDFLTRLITRRKVEDFITEVLCWILENTNFDEEFIYRLMTHPNSKLTQIEGGGTWISQRSFQLLDRRRIPDMLYTRGDGRTELLFEHKVDAPISREQLRDYKQILDSEGFDPSGTILISRKQIPSIQDLEVDCHIYWEDVHEWLSEWFVDVEIVESEFAVQNFLTLLEKRGLGPMSKIESERLQDLPVAIDSEREARRTKREIESELIDFVNRIVKSSGWERITSRIPKGEVGADRATERTKFTWGRYGFYLLGNNDSSTWSPGVFVGVMDDNVNHGPQSVSDLNGSGPIACLIVSVQKDLWTKYRSSEQFTNLLRAFEIEWPTESFDGWLIHEEKRNRWHPLFVYKPLQSLFKHAETGEDQIRLFVDEISKVVETVFRLEEFQSFKNFLSPNPEN